MALISEKTWRQDTAQAQNAVLPEAPPAPKVVLSFDVEEHFRIEAAAGMEIEPGLKAHYSARLEPSTRWLLEQLEKHEIKATFFVVGEIAKTHPRLVRDLAKAGHEVASHSWDHRRLHLLTPQAFRADIRRSKDALEQVSGRPVVGYRAPTFSIVAKTAWALDILAEEEFSYDSSIFPVWHDRYGVPRAPRGPFRAQGVTQSILELPPATWRAWKTNVPAGGGGYFRLLPQFLFARAIRQVQLHGKRAVAVVYFHPWEFDPHQGRLPLGWLNRLRTYVGIGRSRDRFVKLLSQHDFVRAIDVARLLLKKSEHLPLYSVWRR